MVCGVDGMPAPSRYRHLLIKTVHLADAPAFLALFIRRRFERLQREGGAVPDLITVDGGLSQLNAALGEMMMLGVAGIPVIGLAKRFEEIHAPGRSEPLRLPADSKALYVLQRIRDEAHRFAIGYHHRLQARRIRESALDDIPGMGDKRKAALLSSFGSVARLKRAPEKAIAAVPGVGPALAKVIVDWLHRKDA